MGCFHSKSQSSSLADSGDVTLPPSPPVVHQLPPQHLTRKKQKRHPLSLPSESATTRTTPQSIPSPPDWTRLERLERRRSEQQEQAENRSGAPSAAKLNWRDSQCSLAWRDGSSQETDLGTFNKRRKQRPSVIVEGSECSGDQHKKTHDMEEEIAMNSLNATVNGNEADRRGSGGTTSYTSHKNTTGSEMRIEDVNTKSWFED